MEELINPAPTTKMVWSLKQAIRIACAHQRHRDKAGQPYLLHQLRVRLMMKPGIEHTGSPLHDVVEDGDGALARLKKGGFPDAVVMTLGYLTKRQGEYCEVFILHCESGQNGKPLKGYRRAWMDLRDGITVAEAEVWKEE